MAGPPRMTPPRIRGIDAMKTVCVALISALLVLILAGCGKDVHYYIEMGNEAVREGDFQQAVFYFEKAVEKYPESYEAHNSLGAALSAMGNLPRAVEHFSIAVALNKDFVEGHYNLGRGLSGMGRYDEAVVEYQNAIGVDPTYAIAHLGLAEAYLGMNAPEAAIAAYRQAVTCDRNLLQAYIGMGRVYVGIGQYQNGIDAFIEAHEVFPDNADLPFIAGKAAILKRDSDMAIEYLSDAVALDSLNLFYRNDLASAYMLAGRRLDAIAEWEEILARNPNESLREVVQINIERAATRD
jgi:tetratricopeptide (TPR) repeat protein